MNKVKFVVSSIVLAASVAALSGCGAMRANPCTPDAAYNAGMHDGKAGKTRQLNYAENSFCQGDLKTLNHQYRRGYVYGKKYRRHHHAEAMNNGRY